VSPLPSPPAARPLARIALRRVAVPASPPAPPAWTTFDELAALVGMPPASASTLR